MAQVVSSSSHLCFFHDEAALAVCGAKKRNNNAIVFKLASDCFSNCLRD
jgi:hypothetical protein